MTHEHHVNGSLELSPSFELSMSSEPSDREERASEAGEDFFLSRGGGPAQGGEPPAEDPRESWAERFKLLADEDAPRADARVSPRGVFRTAELAAQHEQSPVTGPASPRSPAPSPDGPLASPAAP